MTDSPQTQSVVVDDSSLVPMILMFAAEHGVEVKQVEERGIEPVTTATLILLGTVTAVSTVENLLEQHKGGQVIDLRPDAPRAFYRTSDVLYGLIVVIAVDGEVRIEVREPAGMFGKVISVLPRMLPGGGGAKQVAQVVTKAFGPDVRVDTAESPAPRDDA